MNAEQTSTPSGPRLAEAPPRKLRQPVVHLRRAWRTTRYGLFRARSEMFMGFGRAASEIESALRSAVAAYRAERKG